MLICVFIARFSGQVDTLDPNKADLMHLTASHITLWLSAVFLPYDGSYDGDIHRARAAEHDAPSHET